MERAQLSAQELLKDAVASGVLEDMTKKQEESNKALKEEIKFLDDFSWELLSLGVMLRNHQLVRLFDKLQDFIDQKVIRRASAGLNPDRRS